MCPWGVYDTPPGLAGLLFSWADEQLAKLLEQDKKLSADKKRTSNIGFLRTLIYLRRVIWWGAAVLPGHEIYKLSIFRRWGLFRLGLG
jgi:hypothetical protein